MHHGDGCVRANTQCGDARGGALQNQEDVGGRVLPTQHSLWGLGFSAVGGVFDVAKLDCEP